MSIDKRTYLKHIFTAFCGISERRAEQLLDAEALRLFETSITHKSMSKISRVENYDVLEFYGDSLVNDIVSWYLLYRFPNLGVGWLTKMSHEYRGAGYLASIAKRLRLDTFLKISPMEPSLSDPAKFQKIVSDLVESFCGFIRVLLEKKGYQRFAAFVMCYKLFCTFLDDTTISLKYEDVYDPVTIFKETCDRLVKQEQDREIALGRERPTNSPWAFVQGKTWRSRFDQTTGVYDYEFRGFFDGRYVPLGQASSIIETEAKRDAARKALVALKTRESVFHPKTEDPYPVIDVDTEVIASQEGLVDTTRFPLVLWDHKDLEIIKPLLVKLLDIFGINMFGREPPETLVRTFGLAITHSSLDPRRGRNMDYFKFVGDGVMHDAVASFLVKKYPGLPDRWLAELRKNLEAGRFLLKEAERLCLKIVVKYDKLSPLFVIEENLEKLYSDTVVAICGFIRMYLTNRGANDAVGYEVCMKYLLDVLEQEKISLKYADVFDPVTILRNTLDGISRTTGDTAWKFGPKTVVDTETIEEIGETTSKTFTFTIFGWDGSKYFELGAASSKMKDKAKKEASRVALQQLKQLGYQVYEEVTPIIK